MLLLLQSVFSLSPIYPGRCPGLLAYCPFGAFLDLNLLRALSARLGAKASENEQQSGGSNSGGNSGSGDNGGGGDPVPGGDE